MFSSNVKVFFASLPASCCFDSLDIAMLDCQHDKFAVAIVLGERIVGHVPKNLSKIFHQFMKGPNCTIKHVNCGGGYGLEIPVQYRFTGAKKAVEWAEKNIINSFL